MQLKVNSKMHFGLFIKDISLLRSVEREVRTIEGDERERQRGRNRMKSEAVGVENGTDSFL